MEQEGVGCAEKRRGGGGIEWQCPNSFGGGRDERGEGHSSRAILLPLPYNSTRYVQCNLLASLSSDDHTQTKMGQHKSDEMMVADFCVCKKVGSLKNIFWVLVMV